MTRTLATLTAALALALLLALNTAPTASADDAAAENATVAKADIQQLIRQLKSPKLDERIAAARALSERSPDISPALEPLANALSDEYWDVRRLASEALLKAGSQSVGVLTDTLRKNDYYSRYYASRVLGWMGPEAAGAVDALGEAVETGGIDVKVEASRALSRIGHPEAAAPQLLEQIDHPNPSVRRAVADAIGKAGPAVVPGLTRNLRHEERQVRLTAATALGQLGSDAAPAAEALVQLMREEAAYTWLRLGSNPSEVIRYKNIRGEIRASPVTHAIARVGEPTVPFLIECLHPSDPEVARWAVIAVGGIGSDAAAATPALTRLWESREDEPYTWYCMRGDIAGALSSIGPEAKSAIPALTKTFRENKDSRASLSYAFAGIGKPAVPALIELLSSDDPDIRRNAAQTLQRIGPEARQAIQPLTDLANNDQNEQVRTQATHALNAITSQTKE